MSAQTRFFKMTKAEADVLIVTPESTQFKDGVWLTDGDEGEGMYVKNSDESYTFIGGNDLCCGELVKIGEITFDELNEGEAAATQTITFAGAVPEGFYFEKAFVKTNIAFVSYAGRAALTLNTINPIPSDYSVINEGAEFHTKAVDISDSESSMSSISGNDVNVILGFGGTNPQDWTAGKMSVYVQLINFPTLS